MATLWRISVASGGSSASVLPMVEVSYLPVCSTDFFQLFINIPLLISKWIEGLMKWINKKQQFYQNILHTTVTKTCECCQPLQKKEKKNGRQTTQKKRKQQHVIVRQCSQQRSHTLTFSVTKRSLLRLTWNGYVRPWSIFFFFLVLPPKSYEGAFVYAWNFVIYLFSSGFIKIFLWSDLFGCFLFISFLCASKSRHVELNMLLYIHSYID